MIGVYYLGFALLLSVVAPFLLWRKKARAGLTQKLGLVPAHVVLKAQQDSNSLRIWFHAVSVGELNAITPLLHAVRKAYPHASLFVSTTTATGQQLAKEKFGEWLTVFYFPFDLPWATANWLDTINPHAVIIAETEIWPGFTQQCRHRDIALACVNGRISPRSFKGYRRFSWFFRSVLQSFAAIAVQTEAEGDRYKGLGANPATIHVTGNLKFDGISALDEAAKAQLKAEIKVADDDRVIVAGSTHEGEEIALLKTLSECRKTQPELRTKLILVPRHPERFDRVCKIVEEAGWQPKRFSRNEFFDGDRDVYVLDTIGQLNRFYAVANVAFVGGTIAPIGGHSLIEPYAYGVPVVCGPHTEKTKDIARSLSSCQALVQVADGNALTAAVQTLLADPQQRNHKGTAGRNYLLSSQGAVTRTLSIISGILPQLPSSTYKEESKVLAPVGGKEP